MGPERRDAEGREGSHPRASVRRHGPASPVDAPVAADYRRVLLRQFPFTVVGLASDDAIYVLAIMHIRRDPAGIQGEVAERAEV